MDETTTSAPPVEEGAAAQAPAQPVQTDGSGAAQPQTQVTEPSNDDNLTWLQSKGVDPSSPEAVTKLAEMYRNAEKQLSRVSQEASQLKKSLTPSQQPISGDSAAEPAINEFIADYRRDKMLNSFKESHPDWSQYDSTMGQLLEEAVRTPYGVFTRSQLVNEGLLGLEDIYRMAKGASPVDTEAIKQGAKQEVLQTLANTQRAGGATTHATNSTPQEQADPVLQAIKRSRES
jgi:cytochrome c556